MEGYPWGNGNDRAGLWQWDYATPKEVGGGVAGKARETDWRGGRERSSGDTPARPQYLACLSCGRVGAGKAISQLRLPHPVRDDHLTTPSPSFSVLPTPSKHCCPHFPSPVNFSRQEISPFFPGPESQKQYTRSRNSKGTAQPPQQKHLWA